MKSKILKKIRKLIDHAESAAQIGSAAEAANFAAKVQELLDRHNLSLSDIEREKQIQSEIDAEPISEIDQYIAGWQSRLLAVIAEANGCAAMYEKFGTQIVVGRQSDRKVTIRIYKYFEKLASDLADKFLESYKQTVEYQCFVRHDFYPVVQETLRNKRDGFLNGFVSALQDRFSHQRPCAEETPQTSAALVFVKNKQKEAEDWAQETFAPKEDFAVLRILTDLHSYNSGLEYGAKVALTDKTIR